MVTSNHWCQYWVQYPRFWDSESSWNIIISCNVHEYEMRTLSKVATFQTEKDLCILNKNSGDDSLNPVCWTFRTHNQQFLNLDPRPPVFKSDWRRCLNLKYDPASSSSSIDWLIKIIVKRTRCATMRASHLTVALQSPRPASTDPEEQRKFPWKWLMTGARPLLPWQPTSVPSQSQPSKDNHTRKE